MHLTCIVGARPNFPKMAPIIEAARRAGIETTLVHTGQHYDASLSDSFFAELAVGVDAVVQSAGFVQFLANTGEKIERQREVVASMREHGVSGLIVSPARGTEVADLAPLVDSGIPVVLVVRDIAGADVSSLISDNHAGAMAAVRHLIERGHQRIAFLGGFPDTDVFEARMRGYRDARVETGIAGSGAVSIGSAPARAGGVTAVARAMMLAGRPTAASGRASRARGPE